MELILWRHADAIDSYPDLARELSPRGQQQALRMAGWLQTRLPAHINLIASGATRAQQTLSALGMDFCIEPRLNPGAQPADYLAAAGESNTLIVGHQPDIGRVISLLLSGEDRSTPVSKASVWWLSRQNQRWELRETVNPEQV